MVIKVLNALASLSLAVLTAFIGGLFFIGTKEMHDQMLTESFWGTFGLRFFAAISAGLVAAFVWWALNFSLVRSGLVKEIVLGKLAFSLGAAVTVGALAGALAFCFL